jgi:hypothetical protein
MTGHPVFSFIKRDNIVRTPSIGVQKRDNIVGTPCIGVQ